MNLLEISLISLGLSADAFAVAVSLGLAMAFVNWKNSAVVGLYFGIFQMLMPLAGYILVIWFSGQVEAFGHWLAFILLLLIGGKMIWESFTASSDSQDSTDPPVNTLNLSNMLPLALATSIDAMAVGASFAFLQNEILLPAIFIGVTTFVLSILGVRLGALVGKKFQSKANLIGGIILILIGFRMLLV